MPGAFLMTEGPYFLAAPAAPLASPPSMDPQPSSYYYLEALMMLATPSIMPGAFLMTEGPYFLAAPAAPLASPPSMDPQPRSYYCLLAALAIPPITDGRRP